MNPKRIEVGDSVTVKFDPNFTLDGVIISVPDNKSPIDCWIVFDVGGSILYYIQRFCSMALTAKAA